MGLKFLLDYDVILEKVFHILTIICFNLYKTNLYQKAFIKILVSRKY